MGIDGLQKELLDKEKNCNDFCNSCLVNAKRIFEEGKTESIHMLIQDFNYTQGQRNLCRLLLREYFGINIKGPEYELLGKDLPAVRGSHDAE